ncbi:MAG TPA: sulfite oxidase, partial [Chthoniobacterales bacterium]|nr:sulfite oxidase [Chthoniobacterales bacterium]
RLRIEGAVSRPLALRYEELRSMPSHTITATVECAGNGRSRLEPKVKGVPWDIGAVGNATWSGVFLRDLLQKAEPSPDAIDVILEGADRGPIKEPPRPPDEIHYARSVPLEKAARDVLLAYRMNGEPLSATHGFPLRALVPGWFGMAAVKWLQRIIVTDVPFQGYYQTIDYTYWETHNRLPELKPLREMRVKAQIARPRAGEVLRPNETYRVHGAAWSGEAEVVRVDFSSDGGSSWSVARLSGEPVPYAWRFWDIDWTTPLQPGHYTLMARATDAAGGTQPRERVAAYGTYMVNHVLPTPVEVR